MAEEAALNFFKEDCDGGGGGTIDDYDVFFHCYNWTRDYEPWWES